MVQMTEFRVVMPLSLEEYRIAQSYMVARIQEQQTSDTEGVEVLVSKSFEDEHFGKGQYSSKIYHMQSKAPAWLTALAPKNALLLVEEAWNAYPKCKAILKCPYFNKCKITIETMHVADNGQSPNVHNLTGSKLQIRRVEMVDIASNVKDYWTYVIGGDEVNLANFKSEKTGRGFLGPGWQETCDPVMTAYKLVTVDAPYWGFGYRLEQLALAGERALFLESHKRCFAWIDEWFGLAYYDVRKLELRMVRTLKMAGHGNVQQKRNNSEMEGIGNGVPLLCEGGHRSVLETSALGDKEPWMDSQKNCSQDKLEDDSRVNGNLSETAKVML